MCLIKALEAAASPEAAVQGNAGRRYGSKAMAGIV